MNPITKLKDLIGGSQEEEESSSYPYKFLIIKWMDNATRFGARSWRSKKLVYIEGGNVKWEKEYFPGRAKIISKTKRIPYYDETGGQNAPDVKTYAKEEPGVLTSR